MINEEWNKTQNDAPFVTFHGMRAVHLFCYMKWQICLSRDFFFQHFFTGPLTRGNQNLGYAVKIKSIDKQKHLKCKA